MGAGDQPARSAVVLLVCVTVIYGLAPLHALGQNWRLLFTSFLPALAVMVVLNNVAEEIGWTGFVFARLQHRHGPLRAALATTVFFWLYHVPGFYVDTRSWVTTAVVQAFLLLPHPASRFILGLPQGDDAVDPPVQHVGCRRSSQIDREDVGHEDGKGRSQDDRHDPERVRSPIRRRRS